MKLKQVARVVPLLLATLAATAAVALPMYYLYETQALTRAVPSLATEGLNLDGVRAYRVSACAEAGQTLSGTGTLRAWLYHPDAALWMRNPDLDLAVKATGVRCQAFPDAQPGFANSLGAQPRGHRVLYAADTVGVSGGTTVTVRIDGPAW